MLWEAWLTIAVALSLLASLALRVAATDLLAISCLAVLIVVQAVTGTPNLPTPEAAVLGFGNSGLITVALLFAVVAGLDYTGGTELATGWLLRKAKTLRSAQVRLLLPVAGMSAFLNNTPVVAAMLPVVDDLSKRIPGSQSRLLLPLSYATILGGMCTLIGTSTNLLVSGEYTKETGKTLDFFAPIWVGLPVTVIGVAYMIFASKRLLPDRKAAVSTADDPRQYTVEMQVEAGGPLVGKTIEDAGLRNLSGLYVAEIQREDGVINAVAPGERLRAGDVLILVGALESVVDLRKIRGLATADAQTSKLNVPAWRRTLVEAVVSPRCALIGKTIREGRFRSHYGAAVVAVARGDRRLTGKLGDVKLEVGDVLLLEATPSFVRQRSESHDFFLVSAVDNAIIRRPEKAWASLVILLTMVVVASATRVGILPAAFVASIAMIAMRCCTTTEARRSIDWSVLIVIGAAIGIGNALKQSGAAEAVAGGLLELAGRNPLASLAAIYLATMLCTELITNNAAAMLMFPIAIKSAESLALSEMPFVMAIMIAASACFMTPFGYQTNMMVYGIGGYRLGDYVRFGLPVSVIVFVVSMIMIPMVWPF
jgi:di/tricarboxylate transporter